jgi:hypothetical protein
MLCSCFVYIFIFICTSVGLLPPGESPIAVSSSNSSKEWSGPGPRRVVVSENYYYSTSEETDSSSACQDVPALYETQSSVTVFRTHQHTLFSVMWLEYASSQLCPCLSVISCHNIFCKLSFCDHLPHPALLNQLYFSALSTFSEEYKAHSAVYNFPPPYWISSPVSKYSTPHSFLKDRQLMQGWTQIGCN